MNRNFAILFITLLLLSTFASAELIINKYTNDFTISSPNNEQLKVCSCETKVDKVIVENTGNFYADFSVKVEGNYPRSIRIPNAQFSLAPSHFQEVLVYIEDSCGLTGTYNYDIVITNSYGREQRISRTLRYDVCQTATINVNPENTTVGLCKPAVFQVTVNNIGTFADTYSLDFGPYDAAAQYQKDMYVNAGGSAAQNVSFQFACTDYGTKIIPFSLFTGKNGPAAFTTRDITITNEYNYALDLPTSVDVCAQTATQLPLTVQNSAPASDEIAFSLSAPRFVTMENTVAIGANENKNVTLTATPSQKDIGTYTINIASQDKYGGIAKQRQATLQVSNCYAPTIQMRDTPTSTLTAPVTTCCGPKTFYVNVQNNGDRRQLFELNVDGPSFFTLDETTVTLDPGQNVNIPLRATLPCTDEQYTAKVIVWPKDQQQINATTQVTINDQTQRTCHMVQIDDDEVKITDDATVIPVIVKNTGSAPGNYTITTNSSLFRVQESNISLDAGAQAAIHFVPTANLSTQERGRYIVLPTFTLQQIAYNEAVGVTLQGKGFLTKFIEWLKGIQWSSITLCGWAVFLLAITVIFVFILLLLIYAGRQFVPEGLPKKTLSMMKAGLLVLIIVLLVLMFFLQSPSPQMQYERVANTNATTIEWYQNTQKTIDMSQYFTDPDKDLLTYSVTQPRDIAAKIQGPSLTLTPDHNFAGENTMVITARDPKGGVTDSPVFILRVIPRKHINFVQWIGLWCAYIITIELILLLLLLFLVVLTIKERRLKPYSGNVLVVVNRPAKIRVAKSISKKSGKSTSSVRTSTKSKALVTLPVPQKIRGVPTRATVREYKAGGQTVNIAVGAPQSSPAIVTVPGVSPREIVYVGAKNGNTVHTPYCMNARRIPRNKRVAYSTKREAINAGLVPCRLCRPFEGGL